jgi:hypothetical protein
VYLARIPRPRIRKISLISIKTYGIFHMISVKPICYIKRDFIIEKQIARYLRKKLAEDKKRDY